MADRKALWKSRPVRYDDGEARCRRAREQRALQRNKRGDQMNSRRQVETQEIVKIREEKPPETKAKRIERGRAENDEKERLAAKKKPPFVVGIPHHKYFSPPPPVPGRPGPINRAKLPLVQTQKTQPPTSALPPPPPVPGRSGQINRARSPLEQIKKTQPQPPPPALSSQSGRTNRTEPPKAQIKQDRPTPSLEPTTDNQAKVSSPSTPEPLFGEVFIPDLVFIPGRSGQIDRARSPLEQIKKTQPQPPPPALSSQSGRTNRTEPPKAQIKQDQPAPSLEPTTDNQAKVSSPSTPEPLFGEVFIPDLAKFDSIKIEKVENIAAINEKTPAKVSLAPKDYQFKRPSGINPLPMFGEEYIPTIDIKNFKFNLTNEEATKIQKENESTPMGNKQCEEDKLIKSTQSFDSSIESVALRLSSYSEAAADCTDFKENQGNLASIKSVERSISPVPAQFSPFIVSSRGKSSVRKEQKKRLDLFKNASPQDAIPTKDTVEKLNISMEEEVKTARYYKFLIDNAEDRLKGLCAIWRTIHDDSNTPEAGEAMINQAIGQSELLIAKKFKRFRGLVADCETGGGEQTVRAIDLQGFWELMDIEIRDCGTRFKKLKDLQTKGWVDEEPDVETAPPVKGRRKPVASKQTKIVGKSNIKSFIDVARRKKMLLENANEQTTGNNQSDHLSSNAKETEEVAEVTPEIEHDISISYVNSNQTPGKGILKTNQSQSGKSMQKVNFDEILQVTEVPIDTEMDCIRQKLSFDDDEEENLTTPKLGEEVSQKDDNSPVRLTIPKIQISTPNTVLMDIMDNKRDDIQMVDVVTPMVVRELRNRSILIQSDIMKKRRSTPKQSMRKGKAESSHQDEKVTVIAEKAKDDHVVKDVIDLVTPEDKQQMNNNKRSEVTPTKSSPIQMKECSVLLENITLKSKTSSRLSKECVSPNKENSSIAGNQEPTTTRKYPYERLYDCDTCSPRFCSREVVKSRVTLPDGEQMCSDSPRRTSSKKTEETLCRKRIDCSTKL